MIRVIMRLRPWLPEVLWKPLRDSFWRRFWRREQQLTGETADLQRSERGVLIERIADLYPFRSILEAGCAYGQNFVVYAPYFPQTKIVGVDIHPECVSGARENMAAAGTAHVQILPGDVRSLSDFPDKSFDIVYTCALFLYVPGEDVEQAAKELLRVAKKRVLLMEQHAPELAGDDPVRGCYLTRKTGIGGYWLRDYRKVMEKFVPAGQVTLTKIPDPNWNAEHWKECAHLIEVRLED